MDWFLSPLTETELYDLEVWLGDSFFLVSLAFFAFELVAYRVRRRFSRALVGDALTNFLTLAMFLAINFILLAALYLAAYQWAAQWALLTLDANPVTVAACVVLADLAYYAEHRFTHRVNLAWATHSAHHSSPFFNISVAYRFGPMDGVWPIFFHLPLVLLGFNPFVVFFAEIFVAVYQTLLHTELVGKFPRVFEAVLNTPSHHRVHHGSNPQYLDANYGGVLIVWIAFGTLSRRTKP